MKLNTIITHIRSMRDRDGLEQIANAAEARALKLSNIEGKKERARLWKKVERLGLHAGDMVFIHVAPDAQSSRQHAKLWGQPLTVREVRPRSKAVVVRAPGSTLDHSLSPFTCERLKLSKEPHPEALANALRKEGAPNLTGSAILAAQQSTVSSAQYRQLQAAQAALNHRCLRALQHIIKQMGSL